MGKVSSGTFGKKPGQPAKRLGDDDQGPGDDEPDIERPREEERPDFEKDAPQNPDRPDIPPVTDEDVEDVRRRDLPVA